MNAIKIAPENEAAIEAALLAVNGDATEHTFTKFSELLDLANKAELVVEGIVGDKASAPGAVLLAISGEAVANKRGDRYGRRATSITIERQVSGWYLTHIAHATIDAEGGGRPKLSFKPAQVQAARSYHQDLHLATHFGKSRRT